MAQDYQADFEDGCEGIKGTAEQEDKPHYQVNRPQPWPRRPALAPH